MKQLIELPESMFVGYGYLLDYQMFYKLYNTTMTTYGHRKWNYVRCITGNQMAIFLNNLVIYDGLIYDKKGFYTYNTNTQNWCDRWIS